MNKTLPKIKAGKNTSRVLGKVIRAEDRSDYLAAAAARDAAKGKKIPMTDVHRKVP
jgi:hypothetical protein